MSQKSQDSAAKQGVPQALSTPPATGRAAWEVPQPAAALGRILGSPPGVLSPDAVIALQRTVGNQAVQRALALGNSHRVAVRGAALARSVVLPPVQ